MRRTSLTSTFLSKFASVSCLLWAQRWEWSENICKTVLLFHFKLDNQLLINESNIGSFLTAEFELIHWIIGLLSWHSYSSQKYMVLGQLKIPLRSAEYCNPFSCVFRSTVTIVNDLISWILYSKSFQCNVQLFSLLQRLSGPSSASHPSCKVEPLSPKF